MRTRSLSILLLLAGIGLHAKEIHLKPADFKPITTIPWNEPDANLVIRRIFLEPNSLVRYAILAEYLKIIPLEQFGTALDTCIELECVENPDDLVELFVTIWAQRDPEKCWVRVKDLLRLIGMDEGWLCYDGWTKRPRITVQDLHAIRSSKFWIEQRALSGFTAGVDRSEVETAKKTALLKEFLVTWLDTFGRMPPNPSHGYPSEGKLIVRMLGAAGDPSILSQINGYEPDAEPAITIALRRLIRAKPADAPKVIKMADVRRLSPIPRDLRERSFTPSPDLLMVWADCDLAGLIKWVEARDASDDRFALCARGLLMTRIDDAKRKRWLAQAKTGDNTDYQSALIESWAEWDPKAGLDAALDTKDPQLIAAAARGAAYGPWDGQPWNTSRHGLSVLRDYDFVGLKREALAEVLGEAYVVME
jgi:hypothetical protein